ncbi:MAG: diguanylate cyclase [Deltaproteobacteria bacterium]|jgi:diguanylate cyclase (GGDEF)-like protein|nr:diguanylate cyclase [Deltaproteobacteria bacterium]
MENLQFNGVILSNDEAFKERVLGFWPKQADSWKVFEKASETVHSILGSLPDILLCTMNLQEMSGVQLASMVKSENIYRHIPFMLCLTQEEFDAMARSAEVAEIDDFFILPGSDEEFKTRLDLVIRRSRRSLDTNPLTRLPGNTSIIHYLQACIDRREEFSMGYCDLDFFKSFNDRYGFARGDEVLMMTARVILNTLRQVSPTNYFVGHIGGDDFIFALPADLAEEACKKIIIAFDSIVPQFYDLEDRLKGGIISLDRQGVLRSFPIMAISIAVVANHKGKLKHVGEASQIAMNLKKKAKEDVKSSYVLDRRSNPFDNVG